MGRSYSFRCRLCAAIVGFAVGAVVAADHDVNVPMTNLYFDSVAMICCHFRLDVIVDDSNDFDFAGADDDDDDDHCCCLTMTTADRVTLR